MNSLLKLLVGRPFGLLFSFLMLSLNLSGGAEANAFTSAAKIVHITKGAIIVRMGADKSDVVFQVVGANKEDAKLYHLNARNLEVKDIKPPRSLRPFGPQLKNGQLLYSAGNLAKKVDVYIYNLATGKHKTLDKDLEWIPSMSVDASNENPESVHYFYDKAKDVDGTGAAIYYEGPGFGQAKQDEALIAGPIFRREDIPRQYHDQVKNEYPAFAAATPNAQPLLVFQNNEYGTPNIYSYNPTTKETIRLKPSSFYQERASVSNRAIAWEESERGFSVSDESILTIIDRKDGEVIKIDEKGFHYQARIWGPYVVYGAKRAPATSTPSIRVYDLDMRKEIAADQCFPGAIFDYVPLSHGLFVAQKVSSESSRILYATWEQIRNLCQ